VLNHTQYPSDIIALVVLWRLEYRLALRDLPEKFLIRGIVFSHEAVRDWETKLTPALVQDLRRRRRGNAGSASFAAPQRLRMYCRPFEGVDPHQRLCLLARALTEPS
jgi:hypothetical protein